MHVLTVEQTEHLTTVLFDQASEARKAARILSGLLQARSLQLRRFPRPTTKPSTALCGRAIPRRCCAASSRRMPPLSWWTPRRERGLGRRTRSRWARWPKKAGLGACLNSRPKLRHTP